MDEFGNYIDELRGLLDWVDGKEDAPPDVRDCVTLFKSLLAQLATLSQEDDQALGLACRIAAMPIDAVEDVFELLPAKTIVEILAKQYQAMLLVYEKPDDGQGVGRFGHFCKGGLFRELGMARYINARAEQHMKQAGVMGDDED